MQIATLLCCLFLGVASASTPSGLKDEFSQWAKALGKEYESVEEEFRRLEVWATNRAMIAAHNAEAAEGLHSFHLKMNALGDLTHAEYKSEMLGLRPSSMKGGVAPFQRSLSAAPGSWDWRPKGIVNAVKNQLQCGSCWAFSAVAAMEGAFNLKSNGNVPSECAGNTCGPNKTPCCSFSEQELVDCTDDGGDTCDTGGNPGDGVDEIATKMNGKANTEKQYPYTSGGGTSTGVCKAASKPSGVATGITGYTNVKEGDEAALKEASANNGVLSIGIDASQQSFQFYSHGVYVEPACSSTQLDHGVAIVGYGTLGPSPGPSPSPPSPPSPPAPPSPTPPSPGPYDCIENTDESSCGAEAGCQWCADLGGWCSNSPCLGLNTTKLTASADSGEYWIVRNSWGSSWGLDGYILMARNKDNQCGVATNAIYANVGAEIIV